MEWARVDGVRWVVWQWTVGEGWVLAATRIRWAA